MSETTSPVARRPWHRLMGARDPEQSHRSATPLELLFDLAFVVAIARAAAEMHHAIAENHAVQGILGYFVVFFAIWWAWMNFTWFASAYDCDDVLYRVLTIVQMAGVLVLAVGIPAVFRDFDITLVVVGYVIMRVPMVLQWLRAAREDPERSVTCRTYAAGIAMVQLLWIGLVFVPAPWVYVGFVILLVAELGVPIYAESRGRPTTWHAEHIAERYGLLTLIVLGEVILGVTNALGGAFATGFEVGLLALAVGGLLLVFGLWWIYFLGGDEQGFGSLRVALTWGYAHYFVFGAIAALGAGLEVAVDAQEHVAHISGVAAALSVAIPVAVVLIALSALRTLVWSRETRNWPLVATLAVLLLGCGALAGVVGVGVSVLLMGVVLAGGLTTFLVLAARRVDRVGADV
jgi:low temperature requirement protein LtrA